MKLYMVELNQIQAKKRIRLSPEQRREQLLEAAITVYAEQGVLRAGHGDIAKLTAASTATVFNYFPTREALTDAVLERASSTLVKALDFDGIDANGLTTERIQHLLIGLNTLIEKSPDIAKVILNWSVSFDASVRPQYISFSEGLFEMLHEALGQNFTGEDKDRVEGRLLFAAATGYAIMKLDNSPDAMVDEFVRRVIGSYA